VIKKISTLVLILAVTFGGAFIVPLTANAIGASTNPIAAQCADDTGSAVCQQSASPGTLIKNIVNVLLFVIGAISVVMMIVGGLIFATSAGDSGRVTIARNTLMGAVIGLVVSILAFAIVQFVFTSFK
jgi:hypothetical protein